LVLGGIVCGNFLSLENISKRWIIRFYHDDSSTICFVMITGSWLTIALSDAETKIPIPEEESQETVT
jgi:hypothetical protein